MAKRGAGAKVTPIRKKKTKVVKLPSGMSVTIKKITPLMFGKIFDGSEGMELSFKMVEACTVSPKLRALEQGHADLADDEVSFDDIDIKDFLDLSGKISEFSGLDKVSAVAEGFPKGAETGS